MDNASRQIVNKAWKFAHVQTLPPFIRPPINALTSYVVWRRH